MHINIYKPLYVKAFLIVISSILLLTACSDSDERALKKMYSVENFNPIDVSIFEEKTGLNIPETTVIDNYMNVENRVPFHRAKLTMDEIEFIEWANQMASSPNKYSGFDDVNRRRLGDNYGLWAPQDDFPLPTARFDFHDSKKTLTLGYRENGNGLVTVWLDYF